uniref:Lipopolysaccharide transport periplasmic protein LptA n=1 Tax=Caldimicrobium thiodismutans TaxID=1653476 RepID=A0A832GMU3_9BACT
MQARIFSNLLIFLAIYILLANFDRVFGAREIDINADKMEVYEDEGVAVFTGKVFAQSKDLKLWADKLYLYYIKGEKKRDIQRVIALGRVKMEREKWRAVAGKATYFRDQEKLILEETPKVWHEDNFVEGDLIIIYFNEDRSEVLSKEGGRVRVKIYGK